MKSAVLNPAARLIVVGIIVVASAYAAEPAAPSPRSVRSAAYRVEVGGQAVFTEKFRDVNYAAFVLSAPVEVVVRAGAPIRTFNVSPHAAGIAATSQGAALTFKLDRPRHLVVTINEGEKLFLFGEAPETSPPRP